MVDKISPPGRQMVTKPQIVELVFMGRPMQFRIIDREDHISSILAAGSLYEPDLLQFIFNNLMPPKGMVDVGANVGTHSIFVASVLGLPALAIEPNPAVAEELRDNVRLNGLTGLVEVHEGALGYLDGTGKLQVREPHNRGTASVEIGDGPIMVSSLDGMHLPFEPGLIKVDVEGAELEVLRGAERTILKHRPIVVVEAATVDRFIALAEWLRQRNYYPRRRMCVTPTYAFVPRSYTY